MMKQKRSPRNFSFPGLTHIIANGENTTIAVQAFQKPVFYLLFCFFMYENISVKSQTDINTHYTIIFYFTIITAVLSSNFDEIMYRRYIIVI